jgi:hypothetical protein
VTASRKPPPFAKVVVVASGVPLGFTSVTRAPQHAGPIRTLTTCPETPAKVPRAFWPGTTVVTVRGTPTASASTESGGTSCRVTRTLPVAAPCGSTTIV